MFRQVFDQRVAVFGRQVFRIEQRNCTACSGPSIRLARPLPEPARLPGVLARARGRPYDSDRVALFEDLAAAVQRYSEPSRPPKARDGTGHPTLSFFEAYFSNYIKGTEFTTEDARIKLHGLYPSLSE